MRPCIAPDIVVCRKNMSRQNPPPGWLTYVLGYTASGALIAAVSRTGPRDLIACLALV